MQQGNARRSRFAWRKHIEHWAVLRSSWPSYLDQSHVEDPCEIVYRTALDHHAWLTPFWTPSDSEKFPLGAYTLHGGVLVQTLNALVNSQTSDLHFRILMEFLGDISVWRTAGMKEC